MRSPDQAGTDRQFPGDKQAFQMHADISERRKAPFASAGTGLGATSGSAGSEVLDRKAARPVVLLSDRLERVDDFLVAVALRDEVFGGLFQLWRRRCQCVYSNAA